MITVASIGQDMVRVLQRRTDVIDPRMRSGRLSWLLNKEDWITPVWTFITFYSNSSDIVRFRNDFATVLPKSQWPHRKPEIFGFELTAHVSELDSDMYSEIIDYSELARRQPHSEFDRHPPRFPCGADHGGYGWTQLAWDTQNKKMR